MANTDIRSALERIKAIGVDLDREPELAPPRAQASELLPSPLRKLYSICDGGNALVVDLFTQEQVITRNQAAPFSPGWFPFGSDSQGVFWLCARRDESSKWFTTWDHESGAPIGGAVYSDLPELISEFYQEALQRRVGLGDHLVVKAIPDTSKMKAVIQIKALAGLSTQQALAAVSELPLSSELERASDGKSAMDRLRTIGVECHLRLDFF